MSFCFHELSFQQLKHFYYGTFNMKSYEGQVARSIT
jgi:hypothetical protein